MKSDGSMVHAPRLLDTRRPGDMLLPRRTREPSDDTGAREACREPPLVPMRPDMTATHGDRVRMVDQPAAVEIAMSASCRAMGVNWSSGFWAPMATKTSPRVSVAPRFGVWLTGGSPCPR